MKHTITLDDDDMASVQTGLLLVVQALATTALQPSHDPAVLESVLAELVEVSELLLGLHRLTQREPSMQLQPPPRRHRKKAPAETGPHFSETEQPELEPQPA